MAEVQDLSEEIAEEKGELEVVSEKIEKQEPEKAEVTSKPIELPEKYKGKSLEELAKIAELAEKKAEDSQAMIGRQAQEVGEVRRLADELLKSQLQRKAEEEKPKEVDFFENPQEAIRQAVENNPKVQAAEMFALQAHRENARQKLIQTHPDVGNIIQEKDFSAWVNASKIRARLFKQAEAYDFDAANELLSTYKELKAVKQKASTEIVSEIDTKARDKSLRAAEVDSGGSGESSKKVYRRADLIRLNIRDPAKYAAMSDEIMAAYAEGRVR